jgi:hypothetical protein
MTGQGLLLWPQNSHRFMLDRIIYSSAIISPHTIRPHLRELGAHENHGQPRGGHVGGVPMTGRPAMRVC